MGARSGSNFLSSLKKLNAEVWLGGERVGEVTSHPAFRNCARSVASLYDMQLEHPEQMTYRTDDGGRSGLSFIQPKSVEEVAQALADDGGVGQLQRRNARAHPRLSQCEYRRDGSGARFLCGERSALRRQHRQLLPRSAQARLVRDAYSRQSSRQPRARMGWPCRRGTRAAAGREDGPGNHRKGSADACDARAALRRAAGVSLDGAEG